MPEYLAPGVYVEEVSFRQKTIEGVSTSTTGFIGPTRFGPLLGEPELITSFTDFERIYGGIDRLEFEDATEPMDNYMIPTCGAARSGRPAAARRSRSSSRRDSPDAPATTPSRWCSASARTRCTPNR